MKSGQRSRKKINRDTITADLWERWYLPRPETEVLAVPGRRWRVDFVWRSSERPPLAVEIHGGIWMPRGGHSGGRGQARDFAKGQQLTLMGYARMEFTPRQVRSGYAPAVVRAYLDGRSDRILPPDPEDTRKRA